MADEIRKSNPSDIVSEFERPSRRQFLKIGAGAMGSLAASASALASISKDSSAAQSRPNLVFMLQSCNRGCLARARERVSVVVRIEIIGERLRQHRVTYAEAGQALGLGECARDQEVAVTRHPVRNRLTTQANEGLIHEEEDVWMLLEQCWQRRHLESAAVRVVGIDDGDKRSARRYLQQGELEAEILLRPQLRLAVGPRDLWE